MTTKNLRALAKDYADGLLHANAYRRARDELIEGILAGRIQVTPHDFLPPINTQRVEAASDVTSIRSAPVAKSAQKPAIANTAPRKETRKTHEYSVYRWVLAGIAVILICLLILVALYPFARQGIPAFPSGLKINLKNSGTESMEQQTDISSHGKRMIEEFLHQNNWSEESLRQFTGEWQGLSAEEQATGLASSARTQLANAIHRKLTEERALHSLDVQQGALERQHLLVNFARQIGISDPRLTVQE
jgi:hypothetical protein